MTDTKEKAHLPLGLRLMAAFCKICPCCLISHRWPNSTFARKFKQIQHLCPFCRAQEKVIKIKAEFEREKQVPVNTYRKEPASAK